MNWRFRLVVAFVILHVCACTSTPAPVVDRSQIPARTVLEHDGKYRVRKGDSLYAIAFRFGLDHRDLAAWNGIHSPYVIYPDQQLRMKPPTAVTSKPVAREPVPASRPETATTSPGNNNAPSSKPVLPQAAGSAATPGSANAPASRPTSPAVTQPGTLIWQWPVKGRVVRNYLANDPSRNGLDISGSEGQAVLAAAPGTVVYSGSGLIGYGELIIVKHNDEFLSAYAHNRKRLAEEGDIVSAGQEIAEMGKNDRNETVLHFEIRVNGRPVDPRKHLPPP